VAVADEAGLGAAALAVAYLAGLLVAKLRQARLDKVVSRGYSFQQEVLYRCRRAGCKIGEMPILFENRRAGKSKVNVGEAVRSIAMIFRIGVPAFFGMD